MSPTPGTADIQSLSRCLSWQPQIQTLTGPISSLATSGSCRWLLCAGEETKQEKVLQVSGAIPPLSFRCDAGWWSLAWTADYPCCCAIREALVEWTAQISQGVMTQHMEQHWAPQHNPHGAELSALAGHISTDQGWSASLQWHQGSSSWHVLGWGTTPQGALCWQKQDILYPCRREHWLISPTLLSHIWSNPYVKSYHSKFSPRTLTGIPAALHS